MHMADALLSPAVGGAMWLASAAAIGCCSAKLRQDLDDRKVPLMGVLGAFVFAAQMINFAIPGTGSSGHLGGALLLAILLGPAGAFVTMASVLVVQALLFADGGLLALGCNIFNMAFIPALVTFPFVYRNLSGPSPSRSRLWLATIACAMVGSQLGALAVVLETAASGISALPLRPFLLLMLPIHLPIGLVEGVITAAVVSFLQKARPDLGALTAGPSRATFAKPAIIFLVCAVITAGGLSCFASKNPDGLEWAVARASGKAEMPTPAHPGELWLAELQKKTAFLSGYRIPGATVAAWTNTRSSQDTEAGTGVAGLVGAGITLAGALLAGLLLKKKPNH